ncbi:MAG: Xaa-Pro peptidase family protein [Planctomycetota bacterium]|nr:Xaa-Pro peptidase family protein [Planctomycetota bacterium]MDA1214505.1 Xaa-Pro peptidase family protein [Planctomycetota bacterium]
MLTQAGCQARRARLWQALPDAIEWVLVTDPRHVHYFANFWIPPYNFSDKERAWLLLERDGQTTLLGDNFSLKSTSVGDPFVDSVINKTWYDHRHAVKNRDHVLFDALKVAVERVDVSHCFLEAESTSLLASELLNGAQSTARCSTDVDSVEMTLGTLIRRLRRQKEPDELALLDKCMKATEAGHRRAREVIAAGISEFDIFAAVHQAVLEAAQRPVVIYGDFRANSPETPKQGGLPTKHVLREGELFVLDYSVVMDGYRSDFTNTYAVGNPSDAQRKLFSLCAAGLETGERALRAGITAKEAWQAASKPLMEGGYPNGIPHHAGHGIGLGHPEDPILVRDNDDILLENDVVTLEPGSYIEGIGGVRVEHNFRITATGCERMSHHEIRL